MLRLVFRIVACLGLAATGLGCSDVTAPSHANIELARRVWLISHPEAYTFEVASASSWFPKRGYTRVQVANGEVVAAADSAGNALQGVTITVDSLWNWLLVARERGELNSARFNREGVPLEFNAGPWELDGGVAFWVRNYVRNR